MRLGKLCFRVKRLSRSNFVVTELREFGIDVEGYRVDV